MNTPIHPAAVLVVAAWAASCSSSQQHQQAPVGHVLLEPASGSNTRVDVEIARTPAQLARGLMFRKVLPPDQGMLFIFPDNADHSFWMKNTLIPLDMIFIDETGYIVGIIANAAPTTTTARRVGQASRYVLEVNGGFSTAHNVHPRDQVHFDVLTTAITAK